MIDSREALAWMLRLRGIERPCEACQGFGQRAYASTATWRGGLGGAAVTSDVCDRCWGSGDADYPWTDLRKLRSVENHRVHLRAGELLAERCGVGLSTLLPGLDELVAELEKFSRQRRPRPYGFDTVARCLSNLLRDMVAAKRAEMSSEVRGEGEGGKTR